MFKSNLSRTQINFALSKVRHQKFQNAREKYFALEKGFLTEQSIAWLFCWAKTGMNSESAREESHKAFNRIFAQGSEDLFKQLDSLENFHDYARKVRTSQKNIVQDFKSKVGEVRLKQFRGKFV